MIYKKLFNLESKLNNPNPNKLNKRKFNSSCNYK